MGKHNVVAVDIAKAVFQVAVSEEPPVVLISLSSTESDPIPLCASWPRSAQT
jgi:hypothetical protein